MNKIIINGIEFTGSDISINNGNVIIDGDNKTLNMKERVLNIEGNINGDVDCTNLTVTGDIGGNIDCTNATIRGSVSGDMDGVNVSIRK